MDCQTETLPVRPRQNAGEIEIAHSRDPRRNASISRSSKRRRHDDYVAFHRHSCQLFSSLDGRIAQIQSSRFSSSTSSSSSSFESSPVSAPSTRCASIDFGTSRPLLNRSSTGSDTERNKAAPVLRRAQWTIFPAVSTSSPVKIAVTSISKQPGKTTPPTTTTLSYCSSQTTLPRSLTSNSTLNPTSATTIHWTSPETRRREYARIDAANKGFRLFLRKVFPRSMCQRVGGGRVEFWDERCRRVGRKNDSENDTDDDNDTRSVRRFRIDDEDGEDEDDENQQAQEDLNEKGNPAYHDGSAPNQGDEYWNGKMRNISRRGGNRIATGMSSTSSLSRRVLPDSVKGRKASAFPKLLSCYS